jgi:AcrR family transcriptional regulator
MLPSSAATSGEGIERIELLFQPTTSLTAAVAACKAAGTLAKTAPKPARQRRLTQVERSALTRTRLLNATIESLVKVGYAKTTTIEVGKRADLSRGAQLHHYPNKADLLVAAVEYLADERMRKLQKELGPLLKKSPGDPLTPVFDVLWSSYTGPLFWAALELVVASRTDAEIREKFHALERRVTGRILSAIVELTGATTDEAKAVLEMTLYMMNGMAIERITNPDDGRRRHLMELWKRQVAATLGGSRRAERSR